LLICGTPLVYVAGRVPELCSDNCRDFRKYYNAMNRALDNIDFKDENKLKLIKGNFLESLTIYQRR